MSVLPVLVVNFDSWWWWSRKCMLSLCWKLLSKPWIVLQKNCLFFPFNCLVKSLVTNSILCNAVFLVCLLILGWWSEGSKYHRRLLLLWIKFAPGKVTSTFFSIFHLASLGRALTSPSFIPCILFLLHGLPQYRVDLRHHTWLLHSHWDHFIFVFGHAGICECLLTPL